ncbi:MAG: hypothetical protein HY852_22765 [Bradyrhizobium sp.]|uniref:hypothetical protein n=1 Tax=Bradyrhizobium sp. TaxID=376 RepID=UPI0025BF8C4A|nr:hypothetical protein [Bradyrhizobium sp.]MBI5264627.1 hypothetical protein [Bradyrhizobium sp.]
MKKWWRKWSYDIPLAISDALWEVMVVQFAAFLERLTIRKVLEFIAIAILVMAFAQTFPIDLAILFAGDALSYLEIVVAIRLAAGREAFRDIVRVAVRLASFAFQMAQGGIEQSHMRLKRWRAQRSATRAARPRRSRPKRTEDDGGFGTAWGAFVAA